MADACRNCGVGGDMTIGRLWSMLTGDNRDEVDDLGAAGGGAGAVAPYGAADGELKDGMRDAALASVIPEKREVVGLLRQRNVQKAKKNDRARNRPYSEWDTKDVEEMARRMDLWQRSSRPGRAQLYNAWGVLNRMSLLDVETGDGGIVPAVDGARITFETLYTYLTDACFETFDERAVSRDSLAAIVRTLQRPLGAMEFESGATITEIWLTSSALRVKATLETLLSRQISSSLPPAGPDDPAPAVTAGGR